MNRSLKILGCLATLGLCIAAGCRKQESPSQQDRQPPDSGQAPFVLDLPPREGTDSDAVQPTGSAMVAPAGTSAQPLPTLTLTPEPGRVSADQVAACLAAGDKALANDQPALAVEQFSKAVNLDSSNVEALKGLATALVADKRFDEAVPIYDTLIALTPKDRTARFNLAVALSRTRQFQRAQQVYRQLIEQDPNDLRPQYNLATIYQAQGKFTDAKAAWEMLLTHADRLAPADAAAAYTAYGDVLLTVGKAAEAMTALAEPTKLQPDNPTAWLNFAIAARSAGSYGRAIVATKKAATIAPTDASIWNRLGALCLEVHRATGQTEMLAEALAAWRESLRLNPDQPQLADTVETYSVALSRTTPDSLPASQPTTAQQPGSGIRDSGTRNRESGFGDREPGTASTSQAATAPVSKPASAPATAQQPGTGIRDSGTKNRESGFGDREPGTASTSQATTAPVSRPATRASRPFAVNPASQTAPSGSYITVPASAPALPRTSPASRAVSLPASRPSTATMPSQPVATRPT